MDAHQLLTQTRELLSDPAHWQKGAFGRTAIGDEVPANHPEATCWCLMGAITKTGSDGDASHATILNARRAIAPDRSIIAYNDAKDTKHEDVLAALDQAIERTKPS